MTMKDIGQSIRVAIVGRSQSPELFQTMAALGKDMTISRIEKQA
jgi:glutamyl/glutaminyl-tRNA synthetase